jgi:SH3-like domain-containing protein
LIPRTWCTAALAAFLAGAGLCHASAQTSDPAPYLHTPPAKPAHHAVSHVKAPTGPRTVPVVSPRHAGSPRHPPRPTVLRARPKPAPKPAPKPDAQAAPAAPPAPKKPPPPPPNPNIGANSGQPLPRYESLKSDDVNMRTGPGERYPVKWTYKRRELPVKVEHEFDIWRQVEDMDGEKGWMQQGFLTSRRSFVITGADDRTLRADPADTADAVAILKPGVVGRLKGCDTGKDWCQVQVQDYRGWLKRSDFWGTDPGETVGQ